MTKLRNKKIEQITRLAILAAIIIVLQSLSFVTSGLLPVNLSFVLIPITVGALIDGPKSGAILGAFFGAITVFCGLTSLDKFTFMLINISAIGTILICFVKAILAGLVVGLMYKLFSRISNIYIKAAVSAALCPIVNTSIFLIGMFAFFNDTLHKLAGDTDVFIFIITAFVGVNFIFEFLTTVIISPFIVSAVSKSLGRSYDK